ncbi:protein ORD isoform X1 [Drosophila takahashii]|uniref:protein ORD isoform X1 n=1 Tax=Drosophila takahashii TaxID=29030 RepID=UPI003898E6C2
MPRETALCINHKLHIVSLSINDCLGCDQVHLNFSTTDNVHIIIYDLIKNLPEDLPAVTPVAQAILLICSLTYPNAESLTKIPQLKIGKGKGSVSMNFEMHPLQNGDNTTEIVEEPESDLDETPCTSRQAMERQRKRKERKDKEASLRIIQSNVIKVTVKRKFDTFSTLDSVSYRINGGRSETATISEFHDMFFVPPEHSSNYLSRLYKECSGNWLKVIQSEGDGDAYCNIKEHDGPFETFVRLFDRQAMEPQDVVCQLFKTCLHVNEAVRLAEGKFILEILNQVRQIFEYITSNEYTVWFLVPCLNNKDQLRPMNFDDLDLTKVRTSIRAAGDTRNIYWAYTDHNIKDLLMVAFQLALATITQQSVIVISHLEMLSDFVSMQYVTANYMVDSNLVSSLTYLRQLCILINIHYFQDGVCHPYLQRIVETAIFLGTIVIIEYPSVFTLLNEGRQLIKCYQTKQSNSGAFRWEVEDDIVHYNESLKILKESVVEYEKAM